MPSDFAISQVSTAARSAAAATTSGPPAVPIATPSTQTALPSPSLRLDAGLGVVVIEFRDDTGKVSRSIPTQQQLDAYRVHSEETTPTKTSTTSTTSATAKAPAPVPAPSSGGSGELLKSV